MESCLVAVKVQTGPPLAHGFSNGLCIFLRWRFQPVISFALVLVYFRISHSYFFHLIYLSILTTSIILELVV
jgi:hypothetical protein